MHNDDGTLVSTFKGRLRDRRFAETLVAGLQWLSGPPLREDLVIWILTLNHTYDFCNDIIVPRHRSRLRPSDWLNATLLLLPPIGCHHLM